MVDGVKSAVCRNLRLFMEINEEEFAPQLGRAVTDVWTQLVKVTLNPGQVWDRCRGLLQGQQWVMGFSRLLCGPRHTAALSKRAEKGTACLDTAVIPINEAMSQFSVCSAANFLVFTWYQGIWGNHLCAVQSSWSAG